MSAIDFKKVTIHNAALARVLGVPVETSVAVKCKNGVPVEKEWRNRFKDAEIDGCVSIDQNKAKRVAKPADSTGEPE